MREGVLFAMKKILSIFLAVSFILTMTMTASAAKKIQISVSHSNTSYIYMAAEEFARRANEYSDDSLEFEIVPNGALYEGIVDYGIQQLCNGALQIVILSTATYTNFVPGFKYFLKIFILCSSAFKFISAQVLNIKLLLLNSCDNV